MEYYKLIEFSAIMILNYTIIIFSGFKRVLIYNLLNNMNKYQQMDNLNLE